MDLTLFITTCPQSIVETHQSIWWVNVYELILTRKNKEFFIFAKILRIITETMHSS